MAVWIIKTSENKMKNLKKLMKFVLFVSKEFVGFWDCDVGKSDVISPWFESDLSKKKYQGIRHRDENLEGLEPRCREITNTILWSIWS